MNTSGRKSDVSHVVEAGTPLVPLYRQDPAHQIESEFIPDELYAKALAGMIVVCADVVITNPVRRSVYLTRRQHLPMAGLWVIGGRVMPGESEVAAMQRIFKRETSLSLSLNRFQSLPIMIRYQWSEREQHPQSIGTDSLAYNFTVELSDDELTEVGAGLNSEEYDSEYGLKELSLEQVTDMVKAGMLHPAILRIAQTTFGLPDKN